MTQRRPDDETPRTLSPKAIVGLVGGAFLLGGWVTVQTVRIARLEERQDAIEREVRSTDDLLRKGLVDIRYVREMMEGKKPGGG